MIDVSYDIDLGIGQSIRGAVRVRTTDTIGDKYYYHLNHIDTEIRKVTGPLRWLVRNDLVSRLVNEET